MHTTLSEHVKRTVALALPVMFGRAGLLITITVAMVMIGHAGSNDQAYFAAGFAPHMLVLVFGMGVVASVTVLSAQVNGAGNAQQCGRIWRLRLILAAICGGATGTAMLWGRAILRLAVQSDDIALHGGEVIWMFAPGMPAILMFIATSSFLESIGRPRPGMTVSLATNLVNLGAVGGLRDIQGRSRRDSVANNTARLRGTRALDSPQWLELRAADQVRVLICFEIGHSDDGGLRVNDCSDTRETARQTVDKILTLIRIAARYIPLRILVGPMHRNSAVPADGS